MAANPEAGIPAELLNTPLTKYLADVWRNIVAATIRVRPQFDDLAEIDRLYRRIIDNLNQTEEPVSGMLLFRSHTAYLAAASLALSGQLSDAYVEMRAALESALYGLYMAGNSQRQELWAKRQDSDASRRAMKKEFHNHKMTPHLEQVDSHLRKMYDKLYQRTIDLGAHPNPWASLSQISITTSPTRHEFEANYFVFHDEAHPLCLRSLIQTGLCALSIFEHVYNARYKILQIDTRLADFHGRF